MMKRKYSNAPLAAARAGWATDLVFAADEFVVIQAGPTEESFADEMRTVIATTEGTPRAGYILIGRGVCFNKPLLHSLA